MVMLGGLHTETALWNTLGDMLEGSGWITALTEAEVATSGIAESFLKCSHLTRTKPPQVTLLTLQKLQQEALHLSNVSNDLESTTAWRDGMVKKSPTLMFWDHISL